MNNNFTTPSIESVMKALNAKLPSSIRQTKHYLQLAKAFRLSISTSVKSEHYARHFFLFLSNVSQGQSLFAHSLMQEDALCILHEWMKSICDVAYRAEWSNSIKGDDREDLIATFLERKVLTNFAFASYTPSFAVETFISNCFRNFCISEYRRKSNLTIVDNSESILSHDTFEDELEQQVFDGDILSIMATWVERHHPAYSPIYEMHYVRMMKASEMAPILGISVNATYQRIDQLKRYLRAFGSSLNNAA